MDYSYSSAHSRMNDSCIWHPFTQMQTAKLPILISHAKGAYLYDEAGNRYLDAISSWWVNLHGHAHPYIAEKISLQARKLEHVIFADFTHRPALELAQRLLELLPGKMSKIFFSDNGSTAVECAIKMVIQYGYNQNPKIKKIKIISFKGSYHGDTLGAMSTAGKNEFNHPFRRYLFDVEQIDPPFKGQEERSLKQFEKILKENPFACFIFEPLVMGAGGMLMYPPKGLNALLELCQKYDVLTIADEVMTGFGRTGTYFACEQLSEIPDLICLSKGITGGFLPLGVTVCKEKIYEAFLGDSLQSAFLHGHSYTANPLACTSALASLDLLLKPSCRDKIKMISALHGSFCQKFEKHPNLKRCESTGTILALEYQMDGPTSYFASSKNFFYEDFLKKGILLRPLGNILYVLPPYCIQEKELNFIYEQLGQTLEIR